MVPLLVRPTYRIESHRTGRVGRDLRISLGLKGCHKDTSALDDANHVDTVVYGQRGDENVTAHFDGGSFNSHHLRPPHRQPRSGSLPPQDYAIKFDEIPGILSLGRRPEKLLATRNAPSTQQNGSAVQIRTSFNRSSTQSFLTVFNSELDLFTQQTQPQSYRPSTRLFGSFKSSSDLSICPTRTVAMCPRIGQHYTTHPSLVVSSSVSSSSASFSPSANTNLITARLNGYPTLD